MNTSFTKKTFFFSEVVTFKNSAAWYRPWFQNRFAIFKKALRQFFWGFSHAVGTLKITKEEALGLPR